MPKATQINTAISVLPIPSDGARSAPAKPRNAVKQTPFDFVSDMEDDAQSLLDYGHIVARLADSLASDEANMVARLGWQIIHHARAVEARRGKLFHALHHLKYPRAEGGPDNAA